MGLDYIKRDVFQTFNVFICQSHEFLCNNSSLRQLHNDPNQKETHGYLCVISAEELYEMERILQEEGIKACIIT